MLSSISKKVTLESISDSNKIEVVLDTLAHNTSDEYFLNQLSRLKAVTSLTKTGLSEYRFVDDVSSQYYGDSSYWPILCYYNNIVNPLNFKEEITYNRTFNIPDKADIDAILSSVSSS